ncbi:nitrite reductase small subunit NirD [Marinimicrobium agarilyticum]|uniref:nitrite reductase small subunit NirD n=1 Tax=Marinimicrobium agarilyticum TaxID=306546 RepID=UPI00041CAE24|nr:nitrite reductase small subunit NirD [Marinimicrobium agarilyticum]
MHATDTTQDTQSAPGTAEQQWVEVCAKSDLVPDSGICALINQKQVAIYYSKRLDEVFAIGNYDPIGKANVLSRGMIGSIGDHTVVASPLYKQHFDLRTGECIDSPEHTVPAYEVRVHNDRVEIKI